jgi:hypothetical protein
MVLAMDRETNVAALNKQLESQPSSLDNWISNGNTFIYKRKTTCKDSLPLMKTS